MTFCTKENPRNIFFFNLSFLFRKGEETKLTSDSEDYKITTEVRTTPQTSTERLQPRVLPPNFWIDDSKLRVNIIVEKTTETPPHDDGRDDYVYDDELTTSKPTTKETPSLSTEKVNMNEYSYQSVNEESYYDQKKPKWNYVESTNEPDEAYKSKPKDWNYEEHYEEENQSGTHNLSYTTARGWDYMDLNPTEMQNGTTSKFKFSVYTIHIRPLFCIV